MITIIVPAYNSEKTIGRCLESIFAQTYRDFEVIVVDDGSTDGTSSKVQAVSGKWGNKLKIIRQENRGAQAARNRGWEECITHNPPQPSLTLREGDRSVPPLRVRGGEEGLRIGQYLLFCDADIVMAPTMLEKMVRALEQHPDASYAYSSFKFGWKKFKLWEFDPVRLRQMPYIHTTSLIRSSALEKVTQKDNNEVRPHRNIVPKGWNGPFDESVKRFQDWDLWLTMLEQKHTGVWVPEVLFTVVDTKGSMSRWMPSFSYRVAKWVRIQSRAITLYNEAVARIKAKHNL